MRKLNRPQPKRRDIVFWLIAALIIAGDQYSKFWIKSNLALGQSLPGWEFPHITHIQNTGAAWGIFKGYTPILAVVSFTAGIAILCYIFYFYRRWPYLDTPFGKFTLGVIFGGVVGNLIERVGQGWVTDFINFGFWPAFNVADSSVSIGVVLLVINILLLAKKMDAK